MMVAVIADDLTGAAELASAAADLGFSAEVHTQFDSTSDAQVIAIDTDTRTMPPEAAAYVVSDVTRHVLIARPAWIYKKTDSVLRGNVRAEIEAILQATGLCRALFIPANPYKGRVIRNGMYYVGGSPLAETSFAADPHHPRTTSNVVELLGKVGGLPLAHITSDEPLHSSGIIVPDMQNSAGMQTRAAETTPDTLVAGGVEFFQAVLKCRLGLPSTVRDEAILKPPVLFVCGSPRACRDGRLTQFEQRKTPVLHMPAEIISRAGITSWAQSILNAIDNHACAAAAIGEQTPCDLQPAELATRLAVAIAEVIRHSSISTICMEGGATAAAVLRELATTRLSALPAPAFPGVAAMRTIGGTGPTFLVKPGSYPWPDAVFSIAISRRDS